jgi:hypothetical protein
MNRPQNLTDAERFDRALETISQFFAMDNPQSTFNRVLRDLMDTCPGGVIVGGMAVTFYVKNPRTTKDVDIVLLEGAPATIEFERRFEPVADKPLTVRHRETGIEVDILSPRNPVLNATLLQAASERFRVIDRAGIPVRVTSPEGIIALKLRRAQNNTPEGFQDRSDILSLFRDNPDVDPVPLSALLSGDENDLLQDLLRYRDEMLTVRD